MTSAAAGPDNGPLEVVWSPMPLNQKTIERSDQLRVQSWEDFCAGDVSVNGDGVGASGLGRVVVWECESFDDDRVGSVHAATRAALQVLQRWLADQAGTLVVLTHGAVGFRGEDVSDLAAAAVRGLMLSAQAEHPAGSC